MNSQVLHSPSPQPSPQGEGGTSAYAITCSRFAFRRAAAWLPLLGERVGVRGNAIDARNEPHISSSISEGRRTQKSTFADPSMCGYNAAGHDQETFTSQPRHHCVTVCVTYDRLSLAAALPRGRPGEDTPHHGQGVGIPACHRGQRQRIAL